MKAALFIVLLLGCTPRQEPAQEQPRVQKKKMFADGSQIELELIHPLGACGQWIAKRGANQKWRVHDVCADLTRRAS